jgi:hypothetical protein
VPTGDLITAYHTTGIPNITVARMMPMPVTAARVLLPALPVLVRASRHLPRAGRRTAAALHAPASDAESTVSPPATADQTALESYVWARATAADDRSAEGWLRTGEGYAYTASSAVSTVEAVLASEPLGATTVAAAFGPQIAVSAGGELLATT